jgi:hypothetical protein
MKNNLVLLVLFLVAVSLHAQTIVNPGNGTLKSAIKIDLI